MESCEYFNRCPNVILSVDACDSTKCETFRRLKLERTVQETIKELGLSNEEIISVVARLNRVDKDTPHYGRDYAKFFREEALFYHEESDY